jgi:hypothetical protein
MSQAKPPKAAGSRKPAPHGSPSSIPSDWPLWLAPVLFLGSGFAALTYEIVWFQLLELVVGSSAISLGILLATFMGGMGLGSLWLPRVISAQQHPFRIYAWLELGIGILALAVLFEVPFIGSLYTGSGAHGLWGVFLRGAIAGACLLPPTILMGAALPAISRWVEASPKGVAWLGFLYGSNIAGGIIGCLLAGFYLLRLHDVAMATGVAAMVNFAVSGIAFLMARQRYDSTEAPESGRPSIQKSGGGGRRSTSPSRSRACAHWVPKWSGLGSWRSCSAPPSTPSPSSWRCSCWVSGSAVLRARGSRAGAPSRGVIWGFANSC